jgi:hypothetical protein
MKFKMVMNVASLILFGIAAANAQIGDQTSIGPRVGLNFSNVSNVDNSESATGIAVGLTSTYSISEKSGLTVDILFSQEGYKLSGEEWDINYLQIPIYFDLFFGELGNAFRPKVYVGVVPGFFLGAKQDGVESNSDFYNSFVVAASGGLGFNQRLASRIWLNADLRAYLGLSDIRSDTGVDNDKVAGMTIQPSIGLAYGLNKI